MEISKEDLPEHWDIAFIDADVLKYSAGFAAEKTWYNLYDSGDNLVDRFDSAKSCDDHLAELSEFLMIDTEGYYRVADKVIGEEEHALNACDTIIRFIKSRIKSDNYKFYLSGKGNFRDSVATLYKYGHNRDKVVKPYWINSVVEHLKKEYQAVMTDGIEGDDQIGVGLTSRNKKGEKAIHVGVDKDIKFGIAGYHFDFKADKFYYTSEEEALRFNYCQGICGDATDGFHGIPGIGMKKAEKILAECETEEEMYEAALKAYQDYYGDTHKYTSWDGRELIKTYEELFLENMTLGWIMKEKGKIYNPPVKS